MCLAIPKNDSHGSPDLFQIYLENLFLDNSHNHKAIKVHCPKPVFQEHISAWQTSLPNNYPPLLLVSHNSQRQNSIQYVGCFRGQSQVTLMTAEGAILRDNVSIQVRLCDKQSGEVETAA